MLFNKELIALLTNLLLNDPYGPFKSAQFRFDIVDLVRQIIQDMLGRLELVK